MRNFRVQPLTLLCLLAAAVFVVLGVVYFTTAAKDLPGFFPGHEAGATHHHIKHGLAMIALAIASLIGAWFSTAPSRPESS